MNRQTQIQLVKQLDSSLIDILVSKSKDYATEDVLSNFKRLAAAAKALNINVQTPGGYARFMVIMKIDRLNNLLTSGKVPNNESVADTFADAINYLKLDYCIYEEEQKEAEDELQEEIDKAKWMERRDKSVQFNLGIPLPKENLSIKDFEDKEI